MTIRSAIFIPQLLPRRPPRWRGKILGLACLSLAAFAANANDPPGMRRVEAQGVSLTVTPLSPSQKTAFFIARGFTADEIAPYARTCGFSFAFENRERPPLTTHLAKWKAEVDGRGGRIVHFLPPMLFDREWEQQGIDKSARIAFLWAQFPSDQEFARGDWIMGMANLMERPEGKFRIVARFYEGGKIVELPIDDVACAPLG